MAQELPQVASRALVLDANIVLRAVLGVRVRSLIERYIDRVVLLTPASCVAEVKKYLPELCRKRSWEVEPSTELLQSLLETIQVVDLSLLGEHETEARQRTKVEAAAVLAAMGLTVSDAFRLLLVRAAREKALPFEPLTPNAKTVRAMKEARASKLNAKAPRSRQPTPRRADTTG
jgi:DNA-damage-inducible protein J